MRPSYFMRYGGELYDLGGHTVMGIVNMTPDSFYDRSRINDDAALMDAVSKHLEGGTQIIDIGGYSSRPGADDVSAEQELFRVLWAVERIKKGFGEDVVISVDTFRASVAKRIVDSFGPVIINDITAGEGDPYMLDFVAEYKLPYIAMHMRGTPDTMQAMTNYDNVTDDVIRYFCDRLELFEKKGLGDVIIDPGFGFAKTTEQNFELLYNLERFGIFGRPILVGLSRKTMVWRTLGLTPSEALNGTTALNFAALERGANILRVHDSKEAAQTIKLFEAMTEQAETLR